jgi:hypothetical protein
MPSAALVDFPLLRGRSLYFYHVANKKGTGIFTRRKKLPGLKPGSGANRNKLGLPIGELCVINPFFVGCVVALQIKLDCDVQLVYA